MTGRFSCGKMSTFMRSTANALPTTRATMPTMTVIGWRRAKTMGFRFIAKFLGSGLAAFRAGGTERPVAVLDHFGDEFQQATAGLLEDGAAGGGRAVVAAAAAADDLRVAAEVAQPLQQVQRGVEGALAE